MGACTMRLRNLLLLVMILGLFHAAWAQSPTYGLGKTPTAEEIRAWDIAISPDGKELPPGSGNAKEGALVFVARGCAHCHGPTGFESDIFPGAAFVLLSSSCLNCLRGGRRILSVLRRPHFRLYALSQFRVRSLLRQAGALRLSSDCQRDRNRYCSDVFKPRIQWRRFVS